MDHGHLQRTIDCKQDDQVKAVQQIVYLAAVEPPMVVVTRLIDSFSSVSNCNRKSDESLSSIVTRLTCLASEHLVQAGSSPTSNVGKVLAITMLNNANLDEATLSIAKIEFINAGESRQDGTTRNYDLDDMGCDNLKSIKDSIAQCLQIIRPGSRRRR